jgi:curved DNA-binding protein CbpA
MLEEYYKILGLKKGAKEEEIKTAYRLLAKKHHPDLSNDPDAHNKFIEITEAYEILINKRELRGIKLTAQSRAEAERNTAFFKQRARENAKEAAKMKYENLKREHEAFQKSGMHDFFLVLNYSLHFLLALFAIFLFAFPIYLAVTYNYYFMFILWIVDAFIIWFILRQGESFYKPGTFFYNYNDLKKIFIEELGDGSLPCVYCEDKKANSFPFKIGMMKVHDIQLNFFGTMWHDARYKRSYAKLNIPRSRKAFIVHSSVSVLKIISIIGCMILLPFTSQLWRFFIGIFIGGGLSTIVLLITGTRSKSTYLLTGNILIKILLWIVILLILNDWNFYPDLQTNEFMMAAIGILLFFQDILTDIFTSTLFKSTNFTKPLIHQPNQIQKLVDDGYQSYLDIPIWSTFFPFIKWLF